MVEIPQRQCLDADPVAEHPEERSGLYAQRHVAPGEFALALFPLVRLGISARCIWVEPFPQLLPAGPVADHVLQPLRRAVLDVALALHTSAEFVLDDLPAVAALDLRPRRRREDVLVDAHPLDAVVAEEVDVIHVLRHALLEPAFERGAVEPLLMEVRPVGRAVPECLVESFA